ncbi:MAG: DUF1491 family protein [Pseudomonadota bacterium]
MAARLRSDVQVAALQRQTEAEGLMFAVVKKGHDEAGIIFVKWLDGRDVRLFAEAQIQGHRGWLERTDGPVPEVEADRLLANEQNFDPDLWIVEVIGAARYAEIFLTGS